MTTRSLRAASIGLAVALTPSIVEAATWKVRHDFDLRLNAAAGQVYQAQWAGAARAIAEGRPPAVKDDQNKSAMAGPALAPLAGNVPPNPVKATSGATSAEAYSRFSAAANGTGFHEVGGATTLANGILASSNATSTPWP